MKMSERKSKCAGLWKKFTSNSPNCNSYTSRVYCVTSKNMLFNNKSYKSLHNIRSKLGEN